MRFYWDNLIDLPVGSVTSIFARSSQNDSFPAENVLDELITNVWRTGATVATEYVDFDLGIAKAVSAVVIHAHTLLNTDTLIKVQGTNGSFSPPAFSQTLTWSAGPISAAFSPETYRYWRVTFTKAAAGVTRDIGRIFLGPYYETTIEPDYDGWKRSAEDLTQRQRSEGGQVYSYLKPYYRRPRVDFSDVPQAMLDQLVLMQNDRGIGKSFFAQVKPAGTGELAEVMYVKLSKLFDAPVEGFDADYFYGVSLELEEQL